MKKNPHKLITLYFTASYALTDEQQAEMQRIVNARHRNASLIDPEGKLEPCDFVAGPAIPPSYDHLPRPAMLATEEPDSEEEEEEEVEDPNLMSAPQLREKLTEAGVEFPPSAKKAALVLLYQQHLDEAE